MGRSKICIACQGFKPFSEFYRSARACDGRVSRCKACLRQQQREYYRQDVGRERERARHYYQEHKEQVSAQKRTYYKKHRNEIGKQARVRYPEDKEKKRKRTRDWKRENPEKVRAARARRRAWKNGATGSFSSTEWLALKEQHGGRCLCCGKAEPEVKITPDHVVPLSRGGSNDIINIQPLCLYCNMSKGVKIIDYRCLPHQGVGAVCVAAQTV